MVLIVFLSSRISPLTSTVIFFDRSPVATAVVTSAKLRTYAVSQVFPRPRHALDPRLAAQLAFGPHFARHPRDFGGERTELIDHLVDGLRRAEELALQRLSVDFERHRLRQIALRHSTDHACGLARRMDQIVDELIDRVDRIAPEAGQVAHAAALPEFALLADDAREPLQLLRHPFVALDNIVEHIGN